MAIVVFGNQKGGCGKTTNCIQFANYLSYKGINNNIVLDLDFQRSIFEYRKEDLEVEKAKFDNEEKEIPVPYEVIQTSVEKAVEVLQDFNSIDSGNCIIDLAGNIENDNLLPLLQMADVIVIPIAYDRFTMNSTSFFIQILHHIKVKAKLFFLPNNMQKIVRYDTKKQVNEILSQVGTVLDEIPKKVAMERVSTLDITDEAIEIVQKAYDEIILKSNL